MGTVLFIIALIVVISMAKKNKSLQEELKNAKDVAGCFGCSGRRTDSF